MNQEFKVGYLAENTEFLPGEFFNTSSNPNNALFSATQSLTAELDFAIAERANIRLLYTRATVDNNQPLFDADGTDIQTCLKRVGGNWNKITSARRSPEDISAFVELHVEQGPVLESMSQQIGVVEGIVGQRRFNITVKGSANHAGTTPMQMRCDALVAASQVVLAVNQIGLTPGQQVATVGKMSVLPNAANVVPDWVEMSLDIRDLSSLDIDSLLKQLRIHLKEIAVATKTQIRLNPCLHHEPALAEPYIQKAIALSGENLNLNYTYLPSRASHDAQELAQFTDMGMIFVPSLMGISHDASHFLLHEDDIEAEFW